MNSKMLQLYEENVQLRNELQALRNELALKDALLASRNELLASRNELLASRNELVASKDEQIKSMKSIGVIPCENVQLKEQLAMVKETVKEQATRINQLEEGKSQQQHEMNNIKLSMLQILFDNATKHYYINGMKEQLCREKEKDAKIKVEQREKELDNRTKEVEQRERKLDNRKKELDTREQHLDEEHNDEITKLNTHIDEYSAKQKEYDEVINVLLRALVSYGKQAKYALEQSDKHSTGYYLCNWKIMHEYFASSYKEIWNYLGSNLTNSVSEEKKLMSKIKSNNSIFFVVR